jgi:hypothetical protein
MLALSEISYDEAKTLALPHIQKMEESAEKVARRFGKKPPKFSFTSLMR